MKVDPIISLACSMESKKGIYALLLGSGVSRAAGIPTGWEITLELTKKIALLEDGEEVKNPYEWYKSKNGTGPDYSEIIMNLAKTQSERNEVLKSYFEPDEKSDENDKKPSKAHLAIAKMIKEGYIRVVITTNFDKLLEQALSDEGITPTIISNIDQLKGATPLIHSSCTIVKVHGDYMDNRIKNTEEELSEYDTEMNEYLDRIFDEFGLIICGWSADWDIALRNSIYRCKNNRYSTYWLQKGELSEAANKLVEFKKADVIDIDSAEDFFPNLLEKLDSLNDLAMKESPLTIELARATIKRLLPDTKNIIRVNDIIINESIEIIKQIELFDWSIKPENEEIRRRIESIENICENLINLVSLGCYWGDKEYYKIWIDSFELLINIENCKGINQAYIVWLDLARYPAFLLMYSIILVCVYTERYSLLYKIMFDVKVKDEYSHGYKPALDYLRYNEVIKKEFYNKAFSSKKRYHYQKDYINI